MSESTGHRPPALSRNWLACIPVVGEKDGAKSDRIEQLLDELKQQVSELRDEMTSRRGQLIVGPEMRMEYARITRGEK